jgi:CRP-like cAMP-binding protein
VLQAVLVASGTEECILEEPADIEITEELVPDPKRLPRIPLFSDLPDGAFQLVCERSFLRLYDASESIITEGTKGTSFFIVCEGSVRIFRGADNQTTELARLGEGMFFGEMSLLSCDPRSASVEAVVDGTSVLELSPELLTDVARHFPSVGTALRKFCRQRLLLNVMSTSPMFGPLSGIDRRTLVQRFLARDVPAGTAVIYEGKAADGLYVVLMGGVDVIAQGMKVAELGRGDIFGEISMLTHAPANATVVSSRPTSLLRLPKQDFQDVILGYPQILELISELVSQRSGP